MVELTFLGTGDAFSAGRRKNLALLLNAPGLRMLVECGPVIMAELASAGAGVGEIDCVFVSHGHGDHALGFPMLALSRLTTPMPLDVYAGECTCDILETLCLTSYRSLGLHRRNLQWHRLTEEEPQSIELAAGITLLTMPVAHPPGVPTLAARWDFAEGVSVTFVTDTCANPGMAQFAAGSDLLIHEATYSDQLQPAKSPANHYHSSARQAGEIARQAGCRTLALVHLGMPGSEQPELLAQEAAGDSDLKVIVPDDGQTLRLAGADTT